MWLITPRGQSKYSKSNCGWVCSKWSLPITPKQKMAVSSYCRATAICRKCSHGWSSRSSYFNNGRIMTAYQWSQICKIFWRATKENAVIWKCGSKMRKANHSAKTFRICYKHLRKLLKCKSRFGKSTTQIWNGKTFPF